MNVLKFIDPFAGIGGFRLGLEVCNLGCQKTRDTGVGNTISSRDSGISKSGGVKSQWSIYTCVWSNEWDKYARQIYKKHWGECDGRDIRTVPSKEIPDHDLLCAGWPCQSFSVAGKGLGFEDTRGTLFFEIARIARDKRTRYLLLENVKGLLSHQKGETFQTILRVLANLGYRCEWQVLNSKHFGVPQNRERVFIVGCLGGEGGPKVFPIRKSPEISATSRNKGQTKNQLATAVTQNLKRGVHSGGETYLQTPLIANTLDRDGYLRDGRRKRVDGKAVLTSIPERRIRRLTPIECERLQGFPDGWTEGVSDTQRYKMLGNAVTVNVVEAIGQKLVQELEMVKVK